MIMINVKKATIWSTAAQLITKLLSPFTIIILARLLAPETFGVVATVTVVTSFTDVFIDAGFPKYLIQREFHSITEKNVYTDVAFFSNLLVALLLWGLIIIFRHPISVLVGNSNLSHVIAIACIQLPINALCNIQTALYIRSFNYKDIFITKIISSLIPIFVSIPLAYLGLRHWSIIIGSISGIIFSTALLTIKSEWRPSYFYGLRILKEMISFSSWSIMEGLFIWLTTWVEIIVIGNVFSDYYVGLYTTSYNMVNALMSMITSTIVPILFATLSRMKNDEFLFYRTLLKYQKMIAYFLFPIGIGVFLYREFITSIILGKNWMEAGNIIGICALTTAIKVTLLNVYSEAYRANGQPKLPLLLQILDLCILISICCITIKYGFWTLVYARSLARLIIIIPGLILVSINLKYSVGGLLKNILIPILCTILMSLMAIWLKQLNNSKSWQFISIVISAAFYAFTVIVLDINILYKFYVFFKSREKKKQ